jgi:hypothetical protein
MTHVEAGDDLSQQLEPVLRSFAISTRRWCVTSSCDRFSSGAPNPTPSETAPFRFVGAPTVSRYTDGAEAVIIGLAE